MNHFQTVYFQNDEVKWTEDEELNRTVDDSVLLDETKSVPLHSSTGIKSNSASQIPNFPDRSSEAFNTFIVDQEPSTEETSQDEIYDSKPEFLKIFQNADVKDGEKNFIWHMVNFHVNKTSVNDKFRVYQRLHQSNFSKKVKGRWKK